MKYILSLLICTYFSGCMFFTPVADSQVYVTEDGTYNVHVKGKVVYEITKETPNGEKITYKVDTKVEKSDLSDVKDIVTKGVEGLVLDRILE